MQENADNLLATALSPADAARLDRAMRDAMHPITKIPASVAIAARTSPATLSHSELPQLDASNALPAALAPADKYHTSFLAAYVHQKGEAARAASPEMRLSRSPARHSPRTAPQDEGASSQLSPAAAASHAYATGGRCPTAPAAAYGSSSAAAPRAARVVPAFSPDAYAHLGPPPTGPRSDSPPPGTGGLAVHAAVAGASHGHTGASASSGTGASCSAVLVPRAPVGRGGSRGLRSTSQLERSRWAERPQTPAVMLPVPPPSREAQLRVAVLPNVVDGGGFGDGRGLGHPLGARSAYERRDVHEYPRASTSHEMRVRSIGRPGSPRYLLTPVAAPPAPGTERPRQAKTVR